MEHITTGGLPSDRRIAVARNIRALRKAHKWSQAELAERLARQLGEEKMSPQVILQMEKNMVDDKKTKTREVSMIELWALCQIFGVTPEALWSVPELGEDQMLVTLLHHARTTLASAHLAAHPQWRAYMGVVERISAIMEERADLVERGKDVASIFTVHDAEAIESLMKIATKQASLTQEIETFVRGGLAANQVDH